MKEKPVTILLTRCERQLIATHGYPFRGIAAQLDINGEADLVRITRDPHWWRQVIGHLAHTETDPERSQEGTELRSLIARIAEAMGLISKTKANNRLNPISGSRIRLPEKD